MKQHQQPDEHVALDDDSNQVPTVDFVYPGDDKEQAERDAAREMVARVMGKVLEMAFSPSRSGTWPVGRIVQQRLIVMGILLGVRELNTVTLSEFSRRYHLSKSRATKIANKIRRELGVDGFFISSRGRRDACRRAALRRAAK